MIKISHTDAYQGMDKIDISVMEDEIYTCFNSDQREQTQQFFLLDETTIILEIYRDCERVHEVSFENKADLTESGKGQLENNFKGDGKEMTKNNVEIISGLDKTDLKGMVFKLDSVLSDVMLNSETYNNIDIELGRIADDVENADYTDLTSIVLTLCDIKNSISLLSDLMHYTTKEFRKNVEKLDDLHEGLSDEVRNLDLTEVKGTEHSSTGMKPMSVERSNEIAREHNTKTFISEFGREPKNYEEVQKWIDELVTKSENETKKA